MKRDMQDVINECIEAIVNNEKTVEECLRDHEERRAELEPLLTALIRVRNAAKITPDAARKQQARERLIAAVEQKRWEVGIERAPQRNRATGRVSGRRTIPAKLVAITLAFVLLSGGTMALAQESLPGSPLYPVKLAAERTRIRFASSDTTKARLYLRFAEVRLMELQKFEGDDQEYLELIKAFAESIEAARALTGADPASIQPELDKMAGRNEEVLRAVLEKVPASAKPAIERVLNKGEEEDDADGHNRYVDDEDSDDKPTGNGSKNDHPKGRTSPGSKQQGTQEYKDSKRDDADADNRDISDDRQSPTTRGKPTSKPSSSTSKSSEDDRDSDTKEPSGDDSDEGAESQQAGRTGGDVQERKSDDAKDSLSRRGD